MALRDLAVLLILEGAAAPLSFRELSEAVGLPPGTVRRSVALLERGGYAERSVGTSGRREVRVTATPDGLRLVRDLATGFRKVD